MKFILVAALLTVAVVSASPASNQFEEIDFPVEKIVKKLMKVDEAIARVHCALRVTEEVVGHDEMKTDLEEFKMITKSGLKTWILCAMASDQDSYYECKVNIFKWTAEELKKLFNKVVTNNEESGKEIREKIIEECETGEEYIELAEDTMKLIVKYAKVYLKH